MGLIRTVSVLIGLAIACSVMKRTASFRGRAVKIYCNNRETCACESVTWLVWGRDDHLNVMTTTHHVAKTFVNQKESCHGMERIFKSFREKRSATACHRVTGVDLIKNIIIRGTKSIYNIRNRMVS